MNRNSLLVIAVLVMVGAGLGVASAQLIAPQSPAETHNNGTDISIESIYAASGYGFDDGMEIEIEPMGEPTPEERQKAIDIALSDSKVKDLLDGKEYEIDYVELIGDTHALVEIYFPNASEDDPWYLIVLVDLDKKTVVDVILDDFVFVLPPDKPLTPEEEKQAIDIALSDPNVKELLKGREYNVSGAYSIPSMPEEDRYASVDIYIPNASANMSACMMLEVNLNESIVEHLRFDMFQADDSWRSMCGSAAGWSVA